MASPTPLKGLELVDCARANAKQGAETAAELCGYGGNLRTFKQELKQACEDMGVTFNELSDLITDQDALMNMEGEIVAPDTPTEL
ncbi:hypothetical protein NDI37_20940 [Funiculus sociatus GB2-A5]|uniref:Uncharacterized protein n=1 Tax=Funiculus sociatus GB2-A5 TaxID=2933946 RepID=A0ABV0JU01_9CYAN|nr:MULTISPECIES: hypothetical protein [unclassified Trichocoleus]MBD1906777.1 hypothetical protein [Trichocoleus sp. FACHB-832]MBD2061510.1 hypothetical protein [Trichocoleus sp. FACHB-6]